MTTTNTTHSKTRISRLVALERLCRARSQAADGTPDALRLGKRWERVFVTLCNETD